MGRKKNRFGLSPDPSAAVKRRVRQECGFACVMCSALGMHYDHFDPEYVDCRKHTAAGIALLCPTCHQDKTSGRIDKQAILLARQSALERWSDPAWRSHFKGGTATLLLGSNVLSGATVGFSLGGVRLLTFEAGSDKLEPWRMSGTIVHGDGTVARFDRNEVVACSGNWDVELSGKTLTFRSGPGRIVLQLGLYPGALRIERLELRWASGFALRIDGDGSIVMENLRNTALGTSARSITFTGNRLFVGRGAAPKYPAIRVTDSIGGHQAGDMQFTGNEIHSAGGVADLGTLMDISAYLSSDMLAV